MQEGAKRAVDILLAGSGLILTVPLSLAIALAVRLTSQGPVLYAGTRVGKYGRPFLMYKFRTMRSGAELVGPAITAARDPRVTQVGRLLRLSKLDELPQLINVVRGDMSLVGPRPEAPQYVALYDERQRQVLTVRPGITGPTQLRFRFEETLLPVGNADRYYRTELLPRKLESDLEYVRTRTFWHDVQLLAETVIRLFDRQSYENVEAARR